MGSYNLVSHATSAEVTLFEDPWMKLVYLYLIVNTRANMTGAYYMPVVLICLETCLDEHSVRNALLRLRAKNLVYYDYKIRLIYIPAIPYHTVGPTIKPNDNRRSHLKRYYSDLLPSFICDIWWDHWGEAYGIAKRPDYGQAAPEGEEETCAPPPPPQLPLLQPQPSPEPKSPPKPPQKKPDQRAMLEEADILLDRYSSEQRETIGKVFDLLATTRKNGKLAQTIVLNELKRWDKLDIIRVMYGIHKYTDRGMQTEGKKEEYLYAIMNRATDADLARYNGQTLAKPNGSANLSLVSPITQHNMNVLKQLREAERAKEMDG